MAKIASGQHHLSHKNLKSTFKKHHFGGVLIEFTFCIPVLIALLFFVNDHYRFYGLKNKLKFSAYLAASMIQNISNTRADKRLSWRDLCPITYTSGYNLFYGNSSRYTLACPFGIIIRGSYYWVKKNNDSSYRFYFYRVRPQNDSGSSGYPSDYRTKMGCYRNGILCCLEYYSDNYAESSIRTLNPDLICNAADDEKLLIRYWYEPSNFNKSKLGLFLLTPKITTIWQDHTSSLASLLKNSHNFVYDLVIVPKPGLFPIDQSK